jgi:hypothetical protein
MSSKQNKNNCKLLKVEKDHSFNKIFLNINSSLDDNTYKFKTLIFKQKQKQADKNKISLNLKSEDTRYKSRNNLLAISNKSSHLPIKLSLNQKTPKKKIINKPSLKLNFKADFLENKSRLLSRNNLHTTRSTSILNPDNKNLKSMISLYTRTGLFVDIKKK